MKATKKVSKKVAKKVSKKVTKKPSRAARSARSAFKVNLADCGPMEETVVLKGTATLKDDTFISHSTRLLRSLDGTEILIRLSCDKQKGLVPAVVIRMLRDLAKGIAENYLTQDEVVPSVKAVIGDETKLAIVKMLLKRGQDLQAKVDAYEQNAKAQMPMPPSGCAGVVPTAAT